MSDNCGPAGFLSLLAGVVCTYRVPSPRPGHVVGPERESRGMMRPHLKGRLPVLVALGVNAMLLSRLNLWVDACCSRPE